MDNSKLISIREVEEILNGIPDIVKVFNLNHTVYFCNKTGYEFYNKKPEQVVGKVCYTLLNRKEKCKKCRFYHVLKEKKAIKQERYIEELNKIMDVYYNPIFDEDGNVKFIIERLTDITENKASTIILKKDKERYKQILNTTPDALVIIVDNKIELANNEALRLFELQGNELLDSNIYKYFDEKYAKIMHKKFRKIISGEKQNDLYDCCLLLDQDKKVDVQLSCSSTMYEGKSAILMILRNISDTKKELLRAAHFQKNSLQSYFPFSKFLKIKTVYVPAHIISGDFYRIKKVEDKLAIGILIDVKGKGMQAALNISALELMFIEEISKEHEPIKIVEKLNKKLEHYYEENYIAVSCFSLDLLNKKMKIVGAGINQFIFQKYNQEAEMKVIEGAFLGMFEDSQFSQLEFSINSGDKIFLFSDGLDFLLENYDVIKTYMEKASISEFKKYIDEYLEDIVLEYGNLKDDSTMIAIEIK